MSIQKIIQESINGKPLEMKEAFAEELRNRVAEALAAKMEEVELDEAIHQEGDRVTWHDRSSGKQLTGTVSHPHGGSMDRGKTKLAVVKVDGTHMGSTAKIPHKHLSKLDEDFEQIEEAFVGRETKDGTWRVFKTGNPVAVAGPFKSAQETQAWIKKQSMQEEVELDEALKIGSKVRIHAPGKDYHGKIGHVGEIRKRTYGTMAPSYTVDYREPGEEYNRSVSLTREKIKLHREEVDLDEAVEVRHDRYMRSHGKKARDSGQGSGTWMFTHKDMGDVDYNDEKQVHTARGRFSDAKKSAQQWAKKHGHSAVYVMEEVELDEGLDFQNKTSSNGATTTHIFHNGKHVGTIAKHFTRANPNGSHRIQYNSDTVPAGSKGLHAHEGLPSHDAAKKLVAKHFNIKEAEQIDEISVELAKRVKDKSNARGDAFRNKAGIVSATKDYSMQQARKNWNRADKAANYIKKKQEKEGSN